MPIITWNPPPFHTCISQEDGTCNGGQWDQKWGLLPPPKFVTTQLASGFYTDTGLTLTAVVSTIDSVNVEKVVVGNSVSYTFTGTGLHNHVSVKIHASTCSGTGSCSGTWKCICIVDCPKGTYQNQASQTSCKTCATGLYQDQTGQTECIHNSNCKAGSWIKPDVIARRIFRSPA